MGGCGDHAGKTNAAKGRLKKKQNTKNLDDKRVNMVNRSGGCPEALAAPLPRSPERNGGEQGENTLASLLMHVLPKEP